MRNCLPALAAVVLAAANAAPQPPPVAILKGELVKWDPAGRFQLSAPDRKVRQCSFNEETYLTTRGVRIAATEVTLGDFVEVVADQSGKRGDCYALTVYVLPGRDRAAFAEYRKALERQRHLLDHIVPRGKITLSGLVLELGDAFVLLKTRSGERKRIRLRDDTRYTHDGHPADSSMLEINAVVFVRAGEGFGGELEAYQVVRGKILAPR